MLVFHSNSPTNHIQLADFVKKQLELCIQLGESTTISHVLLFTDLVRISLPTTCLITFFLTTLGRVGDP